MCRMFLVNLGDATLRLFTRLPIGQIDNFRELAEQFTTMFITNSRVVKGLETLANLKKKKDGTFARILLKILGNISRDGGM